MNKIGLYIHIPFCVSKCDYCDFLSFGGTAQATKDFYVEALCAELTVLGEQFVDSRVRTVYIGGGTPSVLCEDNFHKLMDAIYSNYTIESDAEITMEMNPGTVTEDKIRSYVDRGINRVSMGLQSDNDEQLKDLGRIHTFGHYLETYKMIRNAGITNMNVDVMFGLNKQTMAQWQHTLETVIDLDPEHISAYSLIIEPDTVYEDRYDKDELVLPDEDEERAMFWYTHDRLKQAGYRHYEISNYAKEGLESKHNSSYWDLTPYIGAGLGASSFYNNQRYKNISIMDDYIKAKGNLDSVRELEQTNTEATNLEEIFFLGLRKLEGIDLSIIEKQYGAKLLDAYTETIDQLVDEALLIKEGSIIKLSRRGVDISNQVMSQFILD